MVPKEQAPANYVPAAAVIHRGRALSGMTGRKGCVSVGEDSGIPSVAVECIDIGRNTRGESGYLDDN